MKSVSTTSLVEMIARAAGDYDRFVNLRNLVFDYFTDEETYFFSSEILKDVFSVLLPYLQDEEAFGDEQRAERMKRLATALRLELSCEMAVLALEYDRISDLVRRKESGVITDFTYQQQLRKISPVQIDWRRLQTLYASRLW